MADILIIDDEEQIRDLLSIRLQRMNHYPKTAGTLKQGMTQLKEAPFDLVFLDVNLPDGNGLDLLSIIKQHPSNPEVIIITGVGRPEGAELAIKNGAWDYLTKPVSKEDIILRVKRALEYRAIKQTQIQPVLFQPNNIVGKSQCIKNCLKQVAQCAGTGSHVLLFGETGTGKELFAKIIHENSGQTHEDFVVVDCASLPETLAESVLFGHAKGSFTGADKDADGLVLKADKGTLFLDEIGELPLKLQSTFLRVLQEKSFRPVGSSTEKQSDFRLICATNRNLDRMVEKGTFRKDLLHRIRTFAIELPPLRMRNADIPDLANFYTKKLCKKHKLDSKAILSETLELLQSYEWPGNVRELIHTLERAILTEPNSPLLYPFFLPDHIRIKFIKQNIADPENPAYPMNTSTFERTLFSSIDTDNPPLLKEFRNNFLSKIEKVYLTTILSGNGWDVDKTAQISGLSKNRIYVLIKKYGLKMV